MEETAETMCQTRPQIAYCGLCTGHGSSNGGAWQHEIAREDPPAYQLHLVIQSFWEYKHGLSLE
jgi:hypothetical protein